MVKLRGGMERPDAPVCELCASILAEHLGLRVPSSALVMIDEELAEVVAEAESARSDSNAHIIRASIGWNFGSQFVTNLTTWPVDRGVAVSMREAATNVFAFDALIQNPDRTFKNPNLGISAEGGTSEIVIFDHESAFSFLLNILPSGQPWNLETESYLDNHVFAKVLKGERLKDHFLEQLRLVSKDFFDGIAEQVPQDWQAGNLSRLGDHVRLVGEHAEEFATEVERKLA